jgi:NADH-quinone oxidoreductase subunit J
VNVEWVIFGFMFVMALGCSLAMLFAPNAVHVALFLVGAQIALALAFLLQGAFFIAAIQIIVYAGAIMVLFLFVIMLLGIDLRESLVEPLSGQRGLALLLGILLAVGLLFVAFEGVDLAAGGSDGAFSDYVLPFEVTSVLLVVAIVGVMVLARRLSEPPNLPNSATSERVSEGSENDRGASEAAT